jgi:CRISPR/Cas system-associated endoribonuclease Cas2
MQFLSSPGVPSELEHKKINKIDKPLARVMRGHGDSIQINKMRTEYGDNKRKQGNPKNYQIQI